LGKINKTCAKDKIKAKRAGHVAQVVACLPSIHKALGSIPSREKEKERQGRGEKENIFMD
jgi:hypothetical protein